MSINDFELAPDELLIAPEEGHSKAERLRRDPITGRLICGDCWDGEHGTRKKPGCKVSDCRCGCKDGQEEQRFERSKRRAARREQKALEREQLEFPDNPLRAFNPNFREPWRTSDGKNIKRNRRSNRKHKQDGIQISSSGETEPTPAPKMRLSPWDG